MNAFARSREPSRPLGRFIPNPKLRFLDQCREVLRFKQMAWRTEQSYVDWIRRFIVWARDHPHLDPKRTQEHLTPDPSPHPMRRGEPEPEAVERVPTGGWRHPKDMGAVEVRGFLTHLAAERNVAAATQNQALNALVFLYREVVGGELERVRPHGL